MIQTGKLKIVIHNGIPCWSSTYKIVSKFQGFSSTQMGHEHCCFSTLFGRNGWYYFVVSEYFIMNMTFWLIYILPSNGHCLFRFIAFLILNVCPLFSTNETRQKQKIAGSQRLCKLIKSTVFYLIQWMVANVSFIQASVAICCW